MTDAISAPESRVSAETAGSRPERPAYFVADAHLGIESQEIEDAKRHDLLSFLSHITGRSSTLFLVGDLFDFWFEYPWSTPDRHLDVLRAISEVSRAGARVHFLGGNHDYWAGGKLEALTGATVHREPPVSAGGSSSPTGTGCPTGISATSYSRPSYEAGRR